MKRKTVFFPKLELLPQMVMAGHSAFCPPLCPSSLPGLELRCSKGSWLLLALSGTNLFASFCEFSVSLYPGPRPPDLLLSGMAVGGHLSAVIFALKSWR